MLAKIQHRDIKSYTLTSLTKLNLKLKTFARIEKTINGSLHCCKTMLLVANTIFEVSTKLVFKNTISVFQK